MVKPCLHCSEDTQSLTEDFCCLGCSVAYKMVGKFGFENFYKLRQINSLERKIKPEEEEKIDVLEFCTEEKDGSHSALFLVQGLHCAACIWLIEGVLKKQQPVVKARINLSKKTLFLQWQGAPEIGNELIAIIQKIGYKLLPFDAEILKSAEKKYSDSIIRALAVAGFGAGNLMLISSSLWFYGVEEIGKESRNLLHLFSALIALPVIIFSARPFFSSAWRSAKQGYPNMDLAISIAIFLACVVSSLQTFRGATHVYFDSAVMLVFFLLIGRYLDMKARKKAFGIASEFALIAASFGRVEEGGKVRVFPSKKLQEGMILIVAAGEKIAADGVVIEGESEVDTALINGETIPKIVAKNSEVFAGTINVNSPLKIRITKPANKSLLAKIIALSEEAEQKKSRYIRLSDQLAKFYTPAVHVLAFATFVFWFGSGWEIALMNATAVLIITCPCALALAVPIVQTIAISNFTARGILVKSGEALEKLREIDVVVFDKTGSLTVGSPKLVDVLLLEKGAAKTLNATEKNEFLKLAASLACKSRHPISKAISREFSGELQNLSVQENQGFGLSSGSLKLGRKSFCEIENAFNCDQNFLACFAKFGENELVFLFEDSIKEDARDVVLKLKQMGKKIVLLSGDTENPVRNVAEKLQISEFYFEKNPIEKVSFLEKLKAENKKFLMVGDGLNDAPALALSHVSISFSKAADISQNIADVVICGEKLMPIIELVNSAEKSISLMKQNLMLALIYNLFAVPYAMAGHVVPLVAAIAMSTSSLLVLFNSFRMNRSS
jgi:P-type Cu2+ transporter